ncbi:MAG: rhamnosyl transferase [Burkholderiaceae bacterium]|uniref:glycosyltransferase family 2 protein n=1 Tax=Cupriavidus TaxID=106589 RepID=UPI00046334BA|nr:MULTISPECIES: glycosyltransferase [Cupriavidus]KWR83203.1 hypothetical protein RN01_10055 [Cupriavidus sp. SHE]PCH58021.1 MAG: rhamnosyl transferase [Burkholderiaceae bacterium]QWC87898.1 glycosyltransferase family 2 protein [Cupriavidus metallidurans]
MKCAFICVNYNGSQVTSKFVSSVRSLSERAGPGMVEAIIVDNASESSDYESLKVLVREAWEDAKVIRSDVNLGYFGGLNLGLAAIDPRKYDCVIVGNNDLTFDEDFLEKLAAGVYTDDTLVVAPNVITKDGYHQNPHCITRVPATRKFLYRLYYLDYRVARFLTWGANFLKSLKGGRKNLAAHESCFVYMGIGAVYALRPGFFKHYDRLDDSVFLYGEEALLAGQLVAVGGRMFYDSNVVVHHAESATLSKLPSKKTYDFAKASYPKYRSFL